jgi:hypothetical protein
MRRLLLIFILLLVIFFTGCASIYKLQPVDENSLWYKGKQYITSEKDNISLTACFTGTEERCYVLDIEIINHRNSAIVIDPKNFFYSKTDSTGDIVSRHKIQAIDPEFKLMELQKEIENENSLYEVSAGIGTAIGILGLAADIATFGSKTPEESDDLHYAILENNLRMEDARINHESRIYELNEKSKNLEFILLRKTSLFPGEEISGEVYFPYYPHAEYIKFFFPIDNSAVTVVFKQKKF